jgi:hypothetical protein
MKARVRPEGSSEIANALNACGVSTARGGKWAPTQIADILKRAEALALRAT